MNTRSLRSPWIVLAAVLFAPAGQVLAQEDCDVDQEQELLGSWVQIVGEGPGGTYLLAQTFRVGLDGALAAIRFHGGVSNFAPGTGPLRLEVFPTAAGLPDETGPALLTQEIPFGDLPRPSMPADFTIDVLEHFLIVQAEDVLAAVLSVESGSVIVNFRGADPYPDGQLASRAEPGGAWAGTSLDAYFRTSVCPVIVDSVGEGVESLTWGTTKAIYRHPAAGGR